MFPFASEGKLYTILARHHLFFSFNIEMGFGINSRP